MSASGSKKKRTMHRPLNKKNVQTNTDRRAPEGSGLRSQATIKRLKMYNSRPIRDDQGRLIHGDFMSKDTSHSTRIAPNRKWFGNTRTVDQVCCQTKQNLSLLNSFLLTCFCISVLSLSLSPSIPSLFDNRLQLRNFVKHSTRLKKIPTLLSFVKPNCPWD